MKKIYCCLCERTHAHESWRHKPWRTKEGVVDGWACGRHFKDLGQIKEYIPESIKRARKQYAKSLLQPFRGNQLSKEYVRNYPNKIKEMVAAGKITQSEVKNAKNVWRGSIENYQNLDKTK